MFSTIKSLNGFQKKGVMLSTTFKGLSHWQWGGREADGISNSEEEGPRKHTDSIGEIVMDLSSLRFELVWVHMNQPQQGACRTENSSASSPLPVHEARVCVRYWVPIDEISWYHGILSADSELYGQSRHVTSIQRHKAPGPDIPPPLAKEAESSEADWAIPTSKFSVKLAARL
ncbi:hypothetical protein BKA70DRAFT_1216133 [Coprinopsis sp. MPI-PUGE-AT-0042]|nr:hypothetical protein BKA70DRAFT_1216133 [Coprinopsis sp. MPI-PUGE-AT-0042]